MAEERYDIALVGIDPSLPREEVIANLSRRLVKSAEEIEELLARAPAPVLRSVSREEAEPLLAELRKLGARVKPQDEGASWLPPADEGAIELAHRAEDEEPPPRPTLTLRDPDEPPDPMRSRIVIDEPRDVSAEPPEVEEPTPPVADPSASPTPIVVHPDADWVAPKSLPSATFTPDPQPKVAPQPLARPAPSAARRGRAEVIVWDDGSRTFADGLLRALRAPFRRALAVPLALGPLLGTLALALVVFGLRTGDDGLLFVALGVAAAAGFGGIAAQLASSCFVAIAHERSALSLPGRLVHDYLAPGIWLALGYGGAVWLAVEAYATVSLPIFVALAIVLAIYGTLALGLVAANASALALLDAGHVLSLIARGRLRTLAVVLIGGAPLMGGIVGAVVLLQASAVTRTLPVLVANLAIFGSCAALAVTLGAALTGALVALLVRPAD